MIKGWHSCARWNRRGFGCPFARVVPPEAEEKRPRKPGGDRGGIRYDEDVVPQVKAGVLTRVAGTVEAHPEQYGILDAIAVEVKKQFTDAQMKEGVTWATRLLGIPYFREIDTKGPGVKPETAKVFSAMLGEASRILTERGITPHVGVVGALETVLTRWSSSSSGKASSKGVYPANRMPGIQRGGKGKILSPAAMAWMNRGLGTNPAKSPGMGATGYPTMIAVRNWSAYITSLVSHGSFGGYKMRWPLDGPGLSPTIWGGPATDLP